MQVLVVFKVNYFYTNYRNIEKAGKLKKILISERGWEVKRARRSADAVQTFSQVPIICLKFEFL